MHTLGRLRRALAPAAPPLAVVMVGGLIAGAVATGRPAAAGTVAAASTTSTSAATVALSSFDSVALRAASREDDDDVARALSVLGPPERRDRAARSSRSADRAPLHRWVRPNSGPLTSPFGPRWGRLHAGLDLAGPYGSPIVAVTDGCISNAGYESGYGNAVRIQNWDGSESLYAHMSAIKRSSGCVKAGDVIGSLGATGNVTGPHLHVEIHVGGSPVNPMSYLAKRHLFI